MKKLIYLLLAIPLFFTSCNKEEGMVSEESVQVSFSTELPKRIGTRAGTTDLNVNKVVCAVFEDGEEIITLREVITIQEGEDIVFAPRLIKGRTYDVVFWAMKDNNYDVADMTAITRISGTTATENDFDAFTESVEIEVSGSKSETVTLKRPLAQLNLGVTSEDWNAVASVETFGMTPTKMVIKLTGKDTFNALAGAITGEEKELTYTLDVSGEDLVAGENKNEIGWGVQLSSVMRPWKPLTLYFMGNYGRGISSLTGDLMMGNYDLVNDPDTPGTMYAPHLFGWYGAAQYHFTPNLFTGLTVGQLRYLPDHATQPAEYRYGLYSALNLFWNITPRIQVGGEYNLGKRQDQNGEGRWAQRVSLMTQFSF